MSENTKIEWCDHTFNPWVGCKAISPGCKNCYAAALARRTGRDFDTATRTKDWSGPVKWNKRHEAFFAAHGRRQRVFCASVADVFDNAVDPQWRVDLFDLILATPNLDWLLLTKRIGNVRAMLPSSTSCEVAQDFAELYPNVWLGATVVNQEEADRDIPKLLATPAAKRFLSMEPLLGPVDLSRAIICEGCNTMRGDWTDRGNNRCGYCGVERWRTVDWVIAGGESGPGARPSHPDWYRSLRDQCAAAGVPFLFKQWGEWFPINQQQEKFTNRLYKSNRVAKLHEDQSNLDDCYGRRCTVDSTVIHMDGSTHGITEPTAFLQGTSAMSTFKVGKKAAGRLLDGIEHNGFPS